jgi:hypothetical protein
MQQRTWRMDRSFASRTTGLVAASLVLAVTGCRPAAPGGGGAPAPAPNAAEPDAPKGAAVIDPILREARAQADAILSGLLSGKFDNDPDLSPVARKVKGYQSYSIKSQKVVREGAADFRGVLTGLASQGRFDMGLVKQASGKWAVGTFSGPNLE